MGRGKGNTEREEVGDVDVVHHFELVAIAVDLVALGDEELAVAVALASAQHLHLDVGVV